MDSLLEETNLYIENSILNIKTQATENISTKPDRPAMWMHHLKSEELKILILDLQSHIEEISDTHLIQVASRTIEQQVALPNQYLAGLTPTASERSLQALVNDLQLPHPNNPNSSQRVWRNYLGNFLGSSDLRSLTLNSGEIESVSLVLEIHLQRLTSYLLQKELILRIQKNPEYFFHLMNLQIQNEQLLSISLQNLVEIL
ncbi:MAG: hypothetical protein ACOYOK_03950 [Pseudobdellovibrionaceae bacterium]